jgi:modulator of FtsH protease HflC
MKDGGVKKSMKIWCNDHLSGASKYVDSRLCVFLVDGTEYAIVTDFGNPRQVVRSPGLGFKCRYQSVRSIDRRVFIYASPSSEFLTLEETPVVAGGTVLWGVADPRRYFETEFDRAGAESRLGDILFAELGATLGRNPLATFFQSRLPPIGSMRSSPG